MQSFLQRHWPAIAAIGILWMVLAIQIYLDIAQNDGHFIYTFDDAYIHLAIAKNFGEYGIWGVTKYGFTSSASSLIWPLLLSAAVSFTALFDWMPLVLNILFATATLWIMAAILRRYGVAQGVSLGALLLTTLVVPLYAMPLTGMEHLLQTMLMVAILAVASTVLSERDVHTSFRRLLLLPLLAFFMVMTRYEGMFTVGLISLLLAVQRRWLYAGIVAASGILPVLVYGLISTDHGWFFLPNSILLKGTSPDFSSLGGLMNWLGLVLEKLIIGKDVLLLMLGGVLLVGQHRRHQTLWRPADIMLLLFFGSAFLHKIFAAYGFRYTAYLMAAGIMSLSLSLYDYLRGANMIEGRRPVFYGSLALTLLVLAFAAIYRGVLWTLWMPQASTNIYQQQYQMGRFVQRYYGNKCVAVNDIGLVSYLGNTATLDLYGLASREVGELMHRGEYHTEEIRQVSRRAGARIAMVYDNWFIVHGGMPREWQKVGEWKILNNRICGGDVVSIYAVDSTERQPLVEHLREFADELPNDVVQSGIYTTTVSQR